MTNTISTPSNQRHKTPLRKGLPPLPPQMEHLTRDPRGFPVPWFTPWDEDKGEWNFQAMDPNKVNYALKHKTCWICGEPLHRNIAFVLGPMCAITRTNAEPPNHVQCAEFAARACPFLTKPRMRRVSNEVDPDVPGVVLTRNPGVCLVWVCRDFTSFRDKGSFLFKVGDPIRVSAWSEGRPAKADELDHSIETGLPSLLKLVEEDPDPEGARTLFDSMMVTARQVLKQCYMGKAKHV